MSSKEMSDAQITLTDGQEDVGDQEDDSLAEKLSKELSNWRRQRSTSRPKRPDGQPSPNMQSEPARTIRVRGHETLVVRKPKLASKPPTATTEDD
jgi:hypothetical protein